MEKEIAEMLAEKLSQKAAASGNIVQLNDSSLRAVEFSSSSFRQIPEIRESRSIAFIDGGNNTIVESASFCLQAARVYHTVYSGNRRKSSSKKDFFVFASSSKKRVDVEVVGIDEEFSGFDALDSTLALDRHRVSPSAAANACRKLAELRHALAVVDELGEGDVVVLDRDLQPAVTGEREILDKLYEKAGKKNVVVCGIAKTTKLLTDTGSSAAAAVSAKAPGNEWYCPVAEGSNARVYFIKLNRESRYVFRFDVCEKHEGSAEKALSLLKQNSKDPVFLGYPYGMIEADRFARVSSEEAEYMKVRIMAKAGRKSKEILECMKSVDAHSVLDSIS